MHDYLLFLHNLRVLAHFARGILFGLLGLLVPLALVLAWSEGWSLAEAAYFTLITGMTVGYGDLTPVSGVGRVVSVIAAIVGIILTGVYVAIATKAVSASIEGRRLRYVRHQAPGSQAAEITQPDESLPSGGTPAATRRPSAGTRG